MLSSHLILVKEDVGFNYRNFMVSHASEEIAVKKALRKRKVVYGLCHRME